MQRITRYPLLLRQVLHYTDPNTDEHRSIDRAVHVAEKILNHINETIREQEGREKLRMLSEHLWIGQGCVRDPCSHRTRPVLVYD